MKILYLHGWNSGVGSVKPGTLTLHSRGDDVVPVQDSLDVLANSGPPGTALIEVARDHRLADPEPLEALVRAVEGCGRHE